MTRIITWEADIAARCLLGVHCVILWFLRNMLLRNWDRVGQVGRKNYLCPENSSGVGAEVAG